MKNFLLGWQSWRRSSGAFSLLCEGCGNPAKCVRYKTTGSGWNHPTTSRIHRNHVHWKNWGGMLKIKIESISDPIYKRTKPIIDISKLVFFIFEFSMHISDLIGYFMVCFRAKSRQSSLIIANFPGPLLRLRPVPRRPWPTWRTSGSPIK